MGAMVLERDARRRRGRLLYSGAMQITVMEPFHSVFYAPHYVALHLGHFKAEGFDVTTRTGASSAGTTRALIEGSAQISLGGLMRSLDIADRGGRLLPHFAEVNSRNGFFLIGRQPGLIVAFTRAVYRTQRWIATHDAKAVVEAIAPSFADIPRAVCERAVGRYLAQGTWARDPLLRRPGYEYLVDILLGGGFIRRRHRYQDLVDTALAERAMQTLKDS